MFYEYNLFSMLKVVAIKLSSSCRMTAMFLRENHANSTLAATKWSSSFIVGCLFEYYVARNSGRSVPLFLVPAEDF